MVFAKAYVEDRMKYGGKKDLSEEIQKTSTYHLSSEEVANGAFD